MTRGKWVLLGGMPGMLGLLNFAFGVYSVSLSGLTSANEKGDFRDCANICEADPAGKPCDLFSISRRQFTIQSNTVAGERDVVVSVGETRRDACPTLCRHGLGAPFCTCDAIEDSDLNSHPQVPGAVDLLWVKICELFCEEKRRFECRKIGDRSTENKEDPEDVEVSIRSGRIPRSSMDADVGLGPRGAPGHQTDVAGERRDGVDASADFFDLDDGGQQNTSSKIRKSEGETESPSFDLEEFCRIECARGNGGLACNCDVLP